MRKYILIIVLVILAIVFFSIMFGGIKIGPFKINSYNDVIQISAQKDKLLSELNDKNTTEYNEKKQKLSQDIVQYKVQKANYDKLVKEGKITNNNLYNVLVLLLN